MKLSGARVESFVRDPDPKTRAALVYGSDAGLVAERAETLVRAVAEDPADPFRVAHLVAADVTAEPARLFDEAAALALTGGRRVVRLRGAGDAHTEALAHLLDDGRGDTLVVAEAGELPKRSSLRKLFEGAENAAALPCYGDDAGGLERVAQEILGGHGLGVSAEALAYLVDNLGADRQVTRRELEKLALYAGAGSGAGEVGLEDAMASIGDNAALTLEDLAFAVGDGDLAGVDRALSRLYLAGASPVAALRAAARHFQRLHLAAGLVAQGLEAERAMARLRPPVFFKRKESFRAQLGRWPGARLAAALDRLVEAEIKCKTTGLPDQAVCGRALMGLTNAAARHRANR